MHLVLIKLWTAYVCFRPLVKKQLQYLMEMIQVGSMQKKSKISVQPSCIVPAITSNRRLRRHYWQAYRPMMQNKSSLSLTIVPHVPLVHQEERVGQWEASVPKAVKMTERTFSRTFVWKLMKSRISFRQLLRIYCNRLIQLYQVRFMN